MRFVQMAVTAPWRQTLLEALESNKHLKHSTYFQLATVRPNGAPAVRTMVFRGFEEGSNQLLMATDARTRKAAEIKSCSAGELLVYFTDSWEQFRISGLLDLIGPESPPHRQTTRKRLWEEASPKSLLQYVSPHPRLPLLDGEGKQLHVDKENGPLDNFLVLTFEPTEVDYVHLKEEKRRVFLKNGSSQWTEQAVNP